MLVIRAAQLDALTEALLERRIAEHLREIFADRAAALGDGLPAFVREGIAKARRYGLEHPAHVCQLVDMMLVFGRDLDTDPRLPWAGAILRDPEIDHPGTRMLLLCEEAERATGGGAP